MLPVRPHICAALQPHECLAQAGLCFGVALARLRSWGLRSLLPQPLPAAQRPPPGPSIPVPQILLLEIHSIKSEGLRATWRAEPVTQPHLRGWQDTRAASMEHHPGGWRGGAPGCGGPSRVPSRLEGRRRDSAGKLGFLRGAPSLPGPCSAQGGLTGRRGFQAEPLGSRGAEQRSADCEGRGLLEPQDRGVGSQPPLKLPRSRALEAGGGTDGGHWGSPRGLSPLPMRPQAGQPVGHSNGTPPHADKRRL